METDNFGYTIGDILSQCTAKTGQWHSVAFFSRKMILEEIRYKTQDLELLAIAEVFKTWRHYLEDCLF